MQFKESILGDVETKHLDMLKDNTSKPFSFDTSLASWDTYSASRDDYLKRLNREMQEFNSAVGKVRSRRSDRLIDKNKLRAAKRRDWRLYTPCLVVFLVAMVALFLIVYFVMKTGFAYWAKDVIVEETSIKHFFVLFDHQNDNIGLEVEFTALMLAVAVWLALLIFAIVKRVRDYAKSWPIALLIGGLIVGGAPIAIPFFAIRLLFVGLGYVIYFLLTPYGLLVIGGIAAVLMIILGARVRLKRFKALLSITIICTVLFSAGFWYFSIKLNDEGLSLDDIGQTYYDDHNGRSFLSPKELSVTENGYALLYEDNDTFYFEVTSEEGGKYEIAFENPERYSATWYSSDFHELYKKTPEDSTLLVPMMSGEKYYLVIERNEDYYGHYKISFSDAW